MLFYSVFDLYYTYLISFCHFVGTLYQRSFVRKNVIVKISLAVVSTNKDQFRSFILTTAAFIFTDVITEREDGHRLWNPVIRCSRSSDHESELVKSHSFSVHSFNFFNISTERNTCAQPSNLCLFCLLPLPAFSFIVVLVVVSKGYGKEADMWSVGVIMFLLVCGKVWDVCLGCYVCVAWNRALHFLIVKTRSSLDRNAP